MGRIALQHVKEGMRLASDLEAPNGRFILPQGAILRERHLPTLKAWGIVEVDVEGLEPEELAREVPADIAPEELERAERRVEEWFPAAAVPLLRELRRLVILRTAREGNAGDEGVPPPLPSRSPSSSLSLRELVEGESRLVSLPDIYFRIVEAIESPRSSALQIAKVVGKDTSLSAKLLKIVNSSFYGFPSRIESIARAVAIIGGNELSSLALGVSAIQLFRDVPEGFVTMRSFWRHSIAVGVLARLLGTRASIRQDERVFTAGLLHDIGRLLLLRKVPFSMAQILAQSRSRRIPLVEAERGCFGFDHASVGGGLLSEWNLPAGLTASVRFHHNPLGAGNEEDRIGAAALQVADLLAVANRLGSSGAQVLPPLAPEAPELLSLSPNALEPILLQAERQVREIEQVFFGGGER